MKAIFALVLVGCSSSAEPTAAPTQLPLFGDDRVADALMRDAARAPRTLAEHEALFRVGRACDDVFVVEERATRQHDQTIPLDRVVPRVVYGPCRKGLAADLFTVAPTDPAREASDPLARDSIETMALDRTTHAYGFYVFDESGVTRIFRDGDRVRTIVGGRDGSVREVDAGPRCFSCHVHAEPLMPTPKTPWTNWVSSRHPKPQSYAGETAVIVAKAGFADDLEPMVRNSVRSMVAGVELDGRSLFCPTTVQFAASPLALWVDPGAVAGSAIVAPKSDLDLVPVRADWDLRVEAETIARGVLAPETVIALRLVDDENEAFSTVRCALLPPAITETSVRALLDRAFADRTDPAAIYAKALLSGTGVTEARAAYFDSVRARIAATDGMTLESRVRSRRLAARALFPGPSHPIPIAALP
jgi:hypothetical protein